MWIGSPLLAFADYQLRLVTLVAGLAFFVIGLWLFHRSHADLGTNWFITLQVRENHRLVVDGVYRRVRHPMYTALFLYSVGQLLVLPNWVAGPSYLVTFGILFALRVRAEERMMLDAFGADYAAYMARTKRWYRVSGETKMPANMLMHLPKPRGRESFTDGAPVAGRQVSYAWELPGRR